MTIDLQNIKKLFVGNQELKKLYKGNQLIWQHASAWRRQLDLYPRAVRNDEDGNLYVLASSKVQSTGVPAQLKMIKLDEDGIVLFSTDLKKLNTNSSYDQAGFIVVGDYIYIPIYNYLFQIDKKDGTLVEKVALKNNGFVHTEKIGNDIVLMTPGDGMFSTYESFSIPNLVMKKYGTVVYDVVDSKVNKNTLYLLSFMENVLRCVDEDFKGELISEILPDFSYAFEIDDTYFYVCNKYNLIKYDKVTKKQIWQTSSSSSVTGNLTGSLFIVNNRLILENGAGFFIFESTKGELIFSKQKASNLPRYSNKSLAVLEDRYFCRLAYDEKAVYKLELGDEDNYENLD